MSKTTTTTSRSNHNHHHHQGQASAGAGAQLVVVLVLVLDLRMVVVEVSGTCYLLPVVCDGIPNNRPFNIIKLRELGTALNTTLTRVIFRL